MKKLSALVLTYNSESNIKDCLDSIFWISEIIVIDSFSNDDTKKICKRYGNVKFYQREFDNFSSQRNYGLEKIQTEWVLVIDADERVTESLKYEIIKLLNNPCSEGYEIPRKNYFLDKWIKYCGWYPDYTLRLFKSKYRYKGLVHVSLQLNERVSSLKNHFIHYTYSNLESYINKMNKYTTLDSIEKYKKNKSVGLFYIIFRPLFEFIKKYILKKGFLLGSQGLILSMLSAYYQFLKAIKLWELNNFGDEN